MATNLNYSSLFSDLQVYTERGGSETTDTTVYNQIPRLINAAERKIMSALRLLGTQEPLTDTFQAGVAAVITKPDRWRATISMNYGAGSNMNSRTWIYRRSYEYCRAYWPDDTQTAPPQFYADYDIQHWLIVPSPDQAYPFEILCYMQPPLLDETNQTNFFTTYTPNLLRNAALLEMAPFLKDDPRIAVWKDDYMTELQYAAGLDLQRILDRASEVKDP